MVDVDDGQLVTGTVVKVDRDEVLLDIGYKSEGVIPSRELSIRNDVDPAEVVSLGDEIEALVLQKEDKEGRLILSKKRAQYERAWGTIEKIKESEGVVVRPGHRGRQGRPDPRHRPARLPARLARRAAPGARPAALRRQDARGQDHRARQEPQQRGAVAAGRGSRRPRRSSARTSSPTSSPARSAAAWSPRVVNFGAFVDLGGMDGLVHVSELSWKHVDHPGSVVPSATRSTVQVLEVDLDRERISPVAQGHPAGPVAGVRLQPPGRRAGLRPGHQAGALRCVRPGGRRHRGPGAHLGDVGAPRRPARAGRHPRRGAVGQDHRPRPRASPHQPVDQAGRRGRRRGRRVPGALRRARLRRRGQLHRRALEARHLRGPGGLGGVLRRAGPASRRAAAPPSADEAAAEAPSRRGRRRGRGRGRPRPTPSAEAAGAPRPPPTAKPPRPSPAVEGRRRRRASIRRAALRRRRRCGPTPVRRSARVVRPDPRATGRSGRRRSRTDATVATAADARQRLGIGAAVGVPCRTSHRARSETPVSSRRTLILIGAIVDRRPRRLPHAELRAGRRGPRRTSDSRARRGARRHRPIPKGAERRRGHRRPKLIAADDRRRAGPARQRRAAASPRSPARWPPSTSSGGEIVTTTMFVDRARASTGFAAHAASSNGNVAITISVDQAAGVAGLIQPGDSSTSWSRSSTADTPATASRDGRRAPRPTGYGLVHARRLRLPGGPGARRRHRRLGSRVAERGDRGRRRGRRRRRLRPHHRAACRPRQAALLASVPRRRAVPDARTARTTSPARCRRSTSAVPTLPG